MPKCEIFRGILCAWVGSFRLIVSRRKYPDASSAEDGDARQNQTQNRNRKDALAGCGRGAIEEGRMPVATKRLNFKRRQLCGSYPDKKDPIDEQHKRHYRVHRDAELTMVGVTPNRVYVGYLCDG